MLLHAWLPDPVFGSLALVICTPRSLVIFHLPVLRPPSLALPVMLYPSTIQSDRYLIYVIRVSAFVRISGSLNRIYASLAPCIERFSAPKAAIGRDTL